MPKTLKKAASAFRINANGSVMYRLHQSYSDFIKRKRLWQL